MQGSTPTSPEPLTFPNSSIFTKREDFVVSSILRHSQFLSLAIKCLMINNKLRTFERLVILTQDEWDKMVSPHDTVLASIDFLKIVVFQTWWGLQLKNSPMDHAFMLQTKDYASIMDVNQQIANSPRVSKALNQDHVKKQSVSFDDSSRDSFRTSFEVVPKENSTKWKNATLKLQPSVPKPEHLLSNNSFCALSDDEDEPSKEVLALKGEHIFPNSPPPLPTYKEIILKDPLSKESKTIQVKTDESLGDLLPLHDWFSQFLNKGNNSKVKRDASPIIEAPPSCEYDSLWYG